MDSNVAEDVTIPIDISSVDPEVGSSRIHTIEGLSSNGELIGGFRSASEFVTRVELDLACSSEKTVNLNILMMHVATRENDFEAFASETENISEKSFGKALEFDLLSGILDSEVREMDNCMATLQTQIVNAREVLSSCELLGETSMELEEKLNDSAKSLKQAQDQVSEMKIQSGKFGSTVSCFGRQETGTSEKDAVSVESGLFFDRNAKINMQTVEQQRHILRMLEKSLAREMDLEKKLTESRQIEEDLKLRLHSSEQELFSMEEESRDVLERFFEADNAAEVLMGISKGFLGQLQIFQLNLKGSMQREDDLRSKLESSTQELKAKEISLQKLESSSVELHDVLLAQINSLKAILREAEDKLILADSEALTLREKVSSLEEQLKEFEFQHPSAKFNGDGSPEQHDELYSAISEMESSIEDQKEKLSKAESRAESAETKLKLLAETNMELNEELGLLKGGGGTSEKVDLLERQLRDSDSCLQNALVSAEASQEKQSMLNSAIKDMENLIENLKSKVSKAESRAESAEEKLIILSEVNAELNDELSFLRGETARLEALLHKAQETKVTTARDIGIRTKVIANLVMQLSIERKRLHKQMSLFAKENKFLVVKLQQTNKDPSVVMSPGSDENGEEFLFPEDDLTTATGTKGRKEEVSESSATNFEEDKMKNVSVGEVEVEPAVSTSGLETVRRIDAGVLNFKHVFMAMLVLLISAGAYVLVQPNYRS